MLDRNLAVGHELAHLEVTAFDVARTLARLHVLGELNGTLVVHIEYGGLEFASKFEQQPAEVGTYMILVAACEAAMISASVEDRAMLCCLLLP